MRFATPGGPIEAAIDRLVVAGWTGRDRAAVDHHIAELAEIGVPAPSTVPLFYRVSNGLLTQEADVQVLGPDTSGEVEPLIVAAEGRFWIGLGSDHTDRTLEAVSVAASKQACPKPVSTELWPLDDVADHLDALRIRTEIEEGGAWVTYQEGTLAAIRPLPDLIEGAGLSEGGAMLCGTLSAIGGVRPATAYRMVMEDPVTERVITLDYRVATLPVIS